MPAAKPWAYPNSKQCKTCKQILNINMFAIAYSGYLASSCVDCKKAVCKQWNTDHPGSYLIWSKNNPDKVKEAQERYNKKHPHKLRARRMTHWSQLMRWIPRLDYCQDCLTEGVPLDLHHHSYEPGYECDVIQLCKPCHIKWHGGSFK